jgi:PAS domain S-box-containing protein
VTPLPGDGRARSQALDVVVLAASVMLALGVFEWLEASPLPPWARAIGVALAGGLLGTVALRYRDVLRRTFAGEAATQTRSILDSAIDAILTIDERGVIESINPATVRVFGYSREQLVGRNVTMLMPPPYSVEHDAYIQRYLATGEPHIIGIGREVVARRADGKTFPVHLSVSEARIGSRRLFTGIVRDLTEPRHAQAEARRLGAMLEQSLSEICVFDDRALRFALVSRGTRESLGYTLEELQQLTPIDVMPEFTRESLDALLEPLRSGRQRRITFKAGRQRKDGTLYRVEMHVQHVPGPGSGHFIAISQDITEREALESQLAQAQKLEAIGQLAGGIAHDFNNLLTSIQGSSELLATRLPEGDRSQRALARIRQAAERGAALTQKLLAFSRRQAFQAEPLDLNAAVAQVSELAGRLIAEDIDVALDLEPDLHPVLADRTQIDQIVLNLVVNASDAMPGGGKLTLATRNLELDASTAARLGTEPGPSVELRVEDTGVGMSAEVLSHIFEPFFTTKEIGRGTGLGLATVYGILKQNGWGIEVRSEPGRGSAFLLYLPRAAADRTAAATRPCPPRSTGGGETLLLVEDDALVRDMATEILEAEGYQVITAPDPETALARAGEVATLALLISDVVMPQMTGPQVAERLREQRPGLPVLLISGYADEALEARGALPAGLEFLHKPFSNETLVQKIRAILDGA